MTKFFHLILILKTQPFTKSKIEYLSFGCEGHWQYSQISYRSIEYHCNLPKLSLIYIFVTQVVCGPHECFMFAKVFSALVQDFHSKRGKRRVFGIWSLTWKKASHHSLADLNITFEELDLFDLASN